MAKLDVLVPTNNSNRSTSVQIEPGSAILALPFTSSNRNIHIDLSTDGEPTLDSFIQRLTSLAVKINQPPQQVLVLTQNHLDKKFMKVAEYHTDTNDLVPLMPDVLNDWILLYPSH